VNQRAKAAIVSIFATVALIVGGCSSSGNSSGSTAGGGAGGSGSGDTSANVEAAKKLIADAQQRPRDLGYNVPVGKPIPTGKTIDYIAASTEVSVAEANVFMQAGSVLGWTVKIIHTDGTPQQTQNAWVQALREKPDGIAFAGTPPSQIQQYLNQASSMKIPVASVGVTNPNGSLASGNGIGYNIATNNKAAVWAAYLTADSNGDASAVFIGLPAYPIVTADLNQLKSLLSTDCPGCKLDVLNLALTDLGPKTPTLIVSYLRAHPHVKYVVLAADSAMEPGLPAALAAAGLKGVTITGEGPSLATLQDVIAGKQASSIYYPIYEFAYGMMDYFARIIAGVSPQKPYEAPAWLMVKDNIPSTSNYFPEVADLKQIFAKMWGKA